MSAYHSLARDVTFLRALLDLDYQIARSVQGGRCARCGGSLHWAPYPRVPRGVLPEALIASFSRRWSLCCGAEDCRKRVTPPSVCFLGRRQYIAATFLILSMLRYGVAEGEAGEKAVRDFHALVPVDARTLSRWREWWSRQLPATTFWRAAAGRFVPAIVTGAMPASLVTRFLGDVVASVTNCLRFLSPLTTASCRLESSLAMVS